MSQSELARRVSLARHTHITHIEAGRRHPSLALVVRMAYVLCVTTDYLLIDAIELTGLVEQTKSDTKSTFSATDFGAKLRILRRESKVSQSALAEQLQLASQGHISDLEAGVKEPSLDLVVAIAALFGCSIDELLYSRCE